jgi:condensin complex subunit 2
MSTTYSPPVNRRKSVLKKSSVAESSPTSSAQASPLRTSINSNLPAVGRVNDDMAEKAARRKSAHFGDLAENGGKDKAGGNGPSGAGQKRAVSALQVQAQQQANQAAGITGLAGNGKRNKRLSAVAPAAPVVSMEVMNTNFEEWMKLATDNVSDR